MIEEDGYTLEHARHERQRMLIFMTICIIMLLTVVAVILINSRRSSKSPVATLQLLPLSSAMLLLSPLRDRLTHLPPAVKAVQRTVHALSLRLLTAFRGRLFSCYARAHRRRSGAESSFQEYLSKSAGRMGIV
jgi:hypothetical protein